MKYTVTFKYDEDFTQTLVFKGDLNVAHTLQGALQQAGLLVQYSNCIVVKHPVTGLECALCPGDVVEFDTETFKFTITQNNTEAVAKWGRIEFEYFRPAPGTKIVNHMFNCSTNRAENIRVVGLSASLPTTVRLRLRGIDNPDGEILYSGDVAMPKTAVERQSIPPILSYRGHDIRVWSEGTQFILLHSGTEQEILDKNIVCEIFIK